MTLERRGGNLIVRKRADVTATRWFLWLAITGLMALTLAFPFPQIFPFIAAFLIFGGLLTTIRVWNVARDHGLVFDKRSRVGYEAGKTVFRFDDIAVIRVHTHSAPEVGDTYSVSLELADGSRRQLIATTSLPDAVDFAGALSAETGALILPSDLATANISSGVPDTNQSDKIRLYQPRFAFARRSKARPKHPEKR